MKKTPVPTKDKEYDNLSTAYQGKDSREGRLHDVNTDRGTFRFKDERKSNG